MTKYWLKTLKRIQIKEKLSHVHEGKSFRLLKCPKQSTEKYRARKTSHKTSGPIKSSG